MKKMVFEFFLSICMAQTQNPLRLGHLEPGHYLNILGKGSLQSTVLIEIQDIVFIQIYEKIAHDVQLSVYRIIY